MRQFHIVELVLILYIKSWGNSCVKASMIYYDLPFDSLGIDSPEFYLYFVGLCFASILEIKNSSNIELSIVRIQFKSRKV